MRCLECSQSVDQLTNQHLLECSGLTLQEYAIRHHMPLDLLISDKQVNVKDDFASYSLPVEQASKRAQTVFNSLRLFNAFSIEDEFFLIDGEIRRLDQLLWYLREIQAYGFQYRQEYSYTQSSHRVIAKNRLKTLNSYAHKFPQDLWFDDIELMAAVVIAHIGEFHNGYVYLSLCESGDVRSFIKTLTDQFQIRWKELSSLDNSNSILYRTESEEDAQRLLTLVGPHLTEIPCASDRFYAQVEQATVSKELVFDSAHFITDHPDKCENMHGGRYTLNVKVRGRIDPITGFVIDYGYLKSVVKRQVIQKLDHQTLNYVCSELGWRSSTELLNIFIWEQLIDYLPGLHELQTFETTQSYCVYRGPTLKQLQQKQDNPALKYFSQDKLGNSVLRQLLRTEERKDFKVVN